MIPGLKATRLERISDNLVALVSPRRAYLRAHFRAMQRDESYRSLWMAQLNARGYRAAKASSSQTPFSGGGSRSADAEILNDLPKLRDRSRELNRDDPLASGLTSTFVDEVIGTGLWPKPCPKDAAGNLDAVKAAALEKVFWRLADNLYRADRLSYSAAQRMRFRKLLEDGEVFRRSVKRTLLGGAVESVWFEIVEADRVETPLDKAGMVPGGEIRDGIERDKDGVPVAVWILRGHPGDTLTPTRSRKFDRVPFPIAEQIGFKERPGQSRCVPIFHAILQDLRDLDLLLLAALKQRQVAACLALFIKTNSAVPDLLEVTAEAYGYKLDQQIEPGMMFKLAPGEEVQTLVPNMQLAELGPFIVMLARRIGAALGVSWQVVLRDFSESTYSSARTDKLDSYKTYDVKQFAFVEMDLMPEYRVVMIDAVLRGEPELVAANVTIADCQEVEMIPNGRGWIDPVKEVEALVIALEKLGTTSKTEICAKQGKSYPTVLEQRLDDEVLEIERRKAKGLPEKPAATTPPPVPPAPKPDESDDEGKARRGVFSLLRKTA
jgi:lambda family phage portal protein